MKKEKEFRNLLNKFQELKEYVYDDTEYDRLYHGYNRIQKLFANFHKSREIRNAERFSKFLLALYLLDEQSDLQHNRLFSHIPFSRLVKRLLNQPCEKITNQKKYNLTVPKSEMSFFLTFFRPDSPLSMMIPSPIPSNHVSALEDLIKAEDRSSHERFLTLISLL